MRAPIAIAVAIALVAPASADDVCRGRYRGALRDLDVKGADIRDVLRLLADSGDANLVVADDVRGTVTLRVKRVPWDQLLCTVAALHKLHVTREHSVIMVTRADARSPRARPADP